VKSVLQFVAILALVAVTGGAVVITRDAHRLSLDADKTLRDLDGVLVTQSANLAQDEQHVDVALAHLDTTIEQLNQAAIEQRAYWNKTSADSDKTVKAMRLTIDRAALLLDHTDVQLNSSLFPDLDRNLSLTAQSAQMGMASIGHAGDALTFQLDDPAIADLAKNLDATSGQLQQTSEHMAATTADIEQAVHRMTRPPSLLKRIGESILDVGAKLGSMAAGFVR